MIFLNSYADRIYLINGSGVIVAQPQLINAIVANGHTVNVTTSFVLPSNFTTTCVDPINGYDWLCFFGNNDFTFLQTQIKNFIDVGGKVFFQYEVNCCDVSSASVAEIASGLTGLSITPNANIFIAGNAAALNNGWEAIGISCCVNILGSAYKGLDGLPLANQMRATSNQNGSQPSISLCPNFGFYFTTTDFLGTANKGAIVGLGDLNVWHDGLSSSSPINSAIVDYFFPNNSNSCFLLPPGCLNEFNVNDNNLSLGNDTTLCEGQSFSLNPGLANSYLWSSGSTDYSIDVSTTGTYWVELSNGQCPYRDSVNLTFNAAPTLNLPNDTSICQGETISLNAGFANTYLWSNESTNSSIDVSSSGTFLVQASLDQCSKTDSIIVFTIQYPIVDLGNDTALCEGQSIILNAGPASTFLWSDGTTDSLINVSTSGTYLAQASNGKCSTIDSITVYFNQYPIFSLSNDTAICEGQTITLNTNESDFYLWSNSSTDASIIVSTSGTYWVQAANGECFKTDTVLIDFYNCSVEIEMPNVFSPNKDGLNDTFNSIKYNGISKATLRIFDRWGVELFYNEDITLGWDGFYNGNVCSDGTYYWIIQYTTNTNISKELKGFLTLLK